MIRKGILAGLAAWAALAGTAAHAQSMIKADCLYPDEAEAMALMMMPGAVRGARDTCAPSLPRNAYLKTSSDRLIARFRAGARDMGPSLDKLVTRAFGIKLEGGGALVSSMFEPLGETIVLAQSRKLTPEACDRLDRGMALLDPLPARNVAGVLGILLEVSADEKDGKKSKLPFALCKPKRS